MASRSVQQEANPTQLNSAKIILLAQSLSVTASVLGFVGLVMAYKALRSGSDSRVTSRAPTIG